MIYSDLDSLGNGGTIGGGTEKLVEDVLDTESRKNFEDSLGALLTELRPRKEEQESVFDYEDTTYNYAIARAVRRAHMFGDGYDAEDESKYKLTDNTIVVDGHVLYQIEATRDITLPDGTVVKAGEKGGYVESHANLSSEGNCWVAEDAKVYDLAVVEGDATVAGNARVGGMCYVGGSATVNGNAKLKDAVSVTGEALVTDDVILTDSARVTDKATVSGHATLEDHASVSGEGVVTDHVHMRENASVSGKGTAMGNVQMKGHSYVKGEAVVSGNTLMAGRSGAQGKASYGTLDLPGTVHVLSGTQVVGGGVFGSIDPLSHVVTGTADPAVEKELASMRQRNALLMDNKILEAFEKCAKETQAASELRGFSFVFDPDGPDGNGRRWLRRDGTELDGVTIDSLVHGVKDGVSVEDMFVKSGKDSKWTDFVKEGAERAVTGVSPESAGDAARTVAAGAAKGAVAAASKYAGIAGLAEAGADGRDSGEISL